MPGLLRGRFGLLTGGLAAVGLAAVGLAALGPPAVARPRAATPSAAGAEGYGRWELQTGHCDLRMDPQGLSLAGRSQQTCQAVRLDQNLAGFLTVRFLSSGQAGEVAAEQLVFVGELAKDQKPMQCSRHGRCDPHWPSILTVSTVAASRYNQRGLVISLPQTHLARGSCLLEKQRLRCEARGSNGARWQAEARP